MPFLFEEITVPDGVVIGLIGGSGCKRVLESCTDPVLALEHGFATLDAVARAEASMELELHRRRGGIAFFHSHELELVQQIADEVWWFDDQRLKAKGDPRDVIHSYRQWIADVLRLRAAGRQIALTPSMRKGDGRATLTDVQTLDESGMPTSVWRTGSQAAVRVALTFRNAVADPVVGILIRTRIGFEVFGTNTELEKVKLGPCAAGETLSITFRFPCHLCPQEYTLTVASHDPDGVWHDWIEDGVAFSVCDHRYTAGVACLRTEVQVARSPAP